MANAPVRLNLGCGRDLRPGWVNVDRYPTFSPDRVVDLEALPWPWVDGEVDEILLNHVLEHLGADADTYIGIMKELWRVCRDGATVTIAVPHPRHDDFLSDPTHVRPVTEQGLLLFSRKALGAAQGPMANTPLAHYYGIDFDMVSSQMVLEEPWAAQMRDGTVDEGALDEAVRRYNNVVKELRFVLRAVK